jgi:hypothetical protein
MIIAEELLKNPIPVFAYIEIGMSIDPVVRKFLRMIGAKSYKLYLGNILNIDIQGAELLALKGLGNLLENFNFIYTEVNEKEIYIKCALLSEIDEYVSTFGFERRYLNTLNGYGNALYIKKVIK